jgi:23S rRNA (cytidine1920-2'-O)/16S rRNA (cytidine1409-2'-O)-methyltransferase
MSKKERIDVLLVQRGLFETREKARRAIMAGLVFSHLERIDKPGTKVKIDCDISVKGTLIPYVSRGGLKLEKAIRAFNLNLNQKVILDIGASTGGFTDCALQHGASLVYALDVGYNQLDWKLRSDSRVVVMERTNFRYATQEDFKSGIPQLASIDVSFISLKHIFPPLKQILSDQGEIVALIKPQFEAGREQVGKKGIVRDSAVHIQVLKKIVNMAVQEGFIVRQLQYSPVTGGEGNIEFLLYCHKESQLEGQSMDIEDLNLQQIVNQAHQHFNQ